MNPPRVYSCYHPEPPLPPPSPYHPSGSSQCTSPEHPVSCIEPGLAIHFTYDIIHVSLPFSQIISPLPLPQSPKDGSIHLCLFCCLPYRVIITFFLSSVQFSRSAVSNSLRPHELQPTGLLRPWDFLGKSTGVGCHCLLQNGVLLSH